MAASEDGELKSKGGGGGIDQESVELDSFCGLVENRSTLVKTLLFGAKLFTHYAASVLPRVVDRGVIFLLKRVFAQ